MKSRFISKKDGTKWIDVDSKNNHVISLTSNDESHLLSVAIVIQNKNKSTSQQFAITKTPKNENELF